MPPLVTRSFYNSPSSLKVSNTLRQNFRHRTIITNCHWYKKSVFEEIGQRKSEKMKVAPLLLYLTSEVSSRSCRVNVPNNKDFYRNACGLVSSLFTLHIRSICSRNSSNGFTPTTRITSNAMEIGRNALKQVYICLCNATPGMGLHDDIEFL